MVDVDSLLEKGIVAVVPRYRDGSGDSVDFITSDGIVSSCSHTINWALKSIARYYGVDMISIKKRYSEMLGAKHNLPLPFASEAVFMPVKVRKPIVAKDGATGFVNIAYIIDIGNDNEGVYINFEFGEPLRVFQSLNTVRAHLKDAKAVRQDFIYRYVEKRQKIDAFYSVREQCDMPATRGDIAVLTDRLMALMNRLNH